MYHMNMYVVCNSTIYIDTRQIERNQSKITNQSTITIHRVDIVNKLKYRVDK